MNVCHFPLKYVAPIAALVCAVALGCGSRVKPPQLDADSILVAEFSAAGRSWTKQSEMTDEDQSQIARFFLSHPDWTDSTELEGTPIVYAAGDQRRYYWVRPAKQDAIWTCLHWEQKRFRITNGSGPLGSPAD